MAKRKLKSYWWRGEGFTNFGDEIGHLILEKLGYEIEWAPVTEADIVTTGTVLNVANFHCKQDLAVWGSGLGNPADISRFRILALRGQLTAQGMDVPLGDPALLVPRFWPPYPKRYKIGLVRHYVDQTEYPFEAEEIDPTLPVDEVLKKISQCDFIVSSSLHGCIVAKAYGIPYMRLFHPDVIAGDFKFTDFLTSLDRPLSQIQDGLLQALDNL